MPHPEATRLATALSQRSLRLVLAESCTSGLAAALLAGVPGISDYLCGSLVTYREVSKQQWLDVSAELLKTHTAVSAPVTAAMAVGALHHTSEADLAAAVTGHLGPDAPPSLDGTCFFALAQRRDGGPAMVAQQQMQLSDADRETRQRQAAGALLAFVTRAIAQEEKESA